VAVAYSIIDAAVQEYEQEYNEGFSRHRTL
jgi:hypothetical protein